MIFGQKKGVENYGKLAKYFLLYLAEALDDQNSHCDIQTEEGDENHITHQKNAVPKIHVSSVGLGIDSKFSTCLLSSNLKLKSHPQHVEAKSPPNEHLVLVRLQPQ